MFPVIVMSLLSLVAYLRPRLNLNLHDDGVLFSSTPPFTIPLTMAQIPSSKANEFDHDLVPVDEFDAL